MQQLELRFLGDDAQQRVAAQRFQLGCAPVVQGHGGVFALHQQVGMRAGQVVGHVQHGLQVGRVLLAHLAACIAPLHAMLAGGRQAQGREEAIEHVDLAARHHCQRATQPIVQIGQQGDQAQRHLDRFRCLGDADQSAVEVQEQRGVGCESRRRLHGRKP